MKRQYVLELDSGYFQHIDWNNGIVTCKMAENAKVFNSIAAVKEVRDSIRQSHECVGTIHVFVPPEFIPATVKEYDERVDLIERLTVILEYYPQKTDNYQTISDAILYLEGSYR